METAAQDRVEESEQHVSSARRKVAKAPINGETTPASRAKPFPEAPKSTIKHGTIPHEKFWAYRKALPKEFHDRLVFYVYREWPKLDFYKNFTAEQLAEMRAKKLRRPIKYIAKYADIDPDDWRNHLLRFHGSGVYKLSLNDSGVRGNKELDSEQICSTTVELRDDEFSPVVDLAVLDMTDPANNSFINDLRMKGIVLPGDSPKDEGTEEMAQTIAVEALAELAKKGSNGPDNSIPIWFTEMMKQTEDRHLQERRLDAERHARELEAITKRLEQNENKPAAPSTTEQVIAMAKAIVPAPPADNGLVSLLTQMLTNEKSARVEELKLADARLQAEKQNRIEELKLADARHTREMEAVNKRLEQQEARAAQLETARLQQASTPPGKSAIQEAISLVKVLRGATDELSNDSSSGTGNPWVDLVADNLPKFIDTVGNVVTAMKPPVAPVSSMNNPSGAGVPAVQQPQQSQPQDTSEMGMLAAAARLIKDPLLHALQNQIPGSRFGGWIIVNYGEGYYQTAISEGEAGMLKFLQSAPEVWGAVIQFGAPKVQQFITEFLNGPASLEQAALIRQMVGAQQPQQTAPQQQPVPQAMPTPSAARPQQQPRGAIIVDAAPSAPTPAVEPTAGGGARKIIRPDGTPVATKPNGVDVV